MCRITTMEQLVQEGSTSVAQLIIRNNDFPTHFRSILSSSLLFAFQPFVADLTEECRKKDLEKTFMR